MVLFSRCPLQILSWSIWRHTPGNKPTGLEFRVSGLEFRVRTWLSMSDISVRLVSVAISTGRYLMLLSASESETSPAKHSKGSGLKAPLAVHVGERHHALLCRGASVGAEIYLSIHLSSSCSLRRLVSVAISTGRYLMLLSASDSETSPAKHHAHAREECTWMRLREELA